MNVAEPRPTYNAVNRVVASDPAVLQRVAVAIAMVYEGTFLKDALKQQGLTRAMFTSALSGQRELAAMYAEARKVSADFHVDDAIESARNEPDVMRARVIVDVNRWAAGKFDPKYNDRIDINVTQTLDISGTLLEARQRMLRPMRDQLDIEDAQSPVNTGLLTIGAQDIQSSEPDIFAAPEPVVIEQAPATDEPSIFD
jgi:hypothetical protein